MRNSRIWWPVVSLLLVITSIIPSRASADNVTATPFGWVSNQSPFTTCNADINQPGTNSAGSEVEPWVDVNPRAANNIVGTWQQDRWSNGGARGIVAGVSTDAGTTWTSVVIPGLTLCSGGKYQRASDPWLSFAPNGDLYHISLAFDVNPRGFGQNALLVSKSVDGGITWNAPITLIEDSNGRALNDKESITADPTDSHFVYAVWDRVSVPAGSTILPERILGLGSHGPTYFARTIDGGQTWEPAKIIYDPGPTNQTIGNQIVVLPDGTLVDFFTETRRLRLRPLSLSLIRSSDKGVTWLPEGKAVRVATIWPIPVIAPETGEPVRTGDFIPEVAVDPNNGTLYAVWQDARFSRFQHSSIAFAMSTDGGMTWSAPIKINKTPNTLSSDNQQAFTPSVHVAADGTIGVTYYDFRNDDSGSDLKTDYFLIRCRPTLATCADSNNWSEEIRLTDSSFDMRQAPFAGGLFLGDYQGLTSDNNDFLAFFSRAGTTTPADVFFERVRSS